MDDGEFQEADVLWPDTPRDDEPLLPSEQYEAFGGLGSRFEEGESRYFLPAAGPRSSSSGAIPDTDQDDEEWQEADVLWPDDTVGDGSRLGGGAGGSSSWSCRVRPAAAPRRQGYWAPGASSPIDIPADVFARRRRVRVCAGMGRRL